MKHSEPFICRTICPINSRLVDETGAVVAEHDAPEYLRITSKPFIAATMRIDLLNGIDCELLDGDVVVGKFESLAAAGREIGISVDSAKDAARKFALIRGRYRIRKIEKVSK